MCGGNIPVFLMATVFRFSWVFVLLPAWLCQASDGGQTRVRLENREAGASQRWGSQGAPIERTELLCHSESSYNTLLKDTLMLVPLVSPFVIFNRKCQEVSEEPQ